MTTLTVIPRASGFDLASLLAQVGFGSTEAFAELYDQVAPTVHAMSSAVFKDSGESAAATEEAFFDIWRSAPRYRAGQNSEKWLLAVAVRSVGRRLSSSPALLNSPAKTPERHPE